MPWTIGDVDQFKQGLTDKQKRQWVRIANNARRKNQSAEDADTVAIRQANAAVKTNLQSYVSTNSEYTVRREVHKGKTHIVVPVTLMVEGVHNGNHGPLYHPIEELGAAVEAWNGRPVTISHPKSGGEFVSATVPGILQRYGVGNIFDVRIDGDRLRGEAWIDETKIKAKSPDAYRSIERGEPLEVSAGLFSEDEMIGGRWHNESYNAISRNHRPDHLALLPGEKGACSWEDGCGVRANQKGGNDMPNDDHLNKEEHLENLLNNKEAGYREVISNIQEKLNAMDTDLRLYFLTDVYDDFFVYEVRPREGGGPPKMYKRGYSVNEDTSIDFAEEPAEVRKQVSYVNLSEEGIKRTKLNNNKKEGKMPDVKKPCDGCEALVDQLITNAKTPFEDKDKERLLEMTEDQVTGLIQAYAEKKKEEPKEPEPKKEEPAKVTANAEEAPKFKSAEEFLEAVPAEFKESFDSGLRLHKEKREGMVKAILANTDEGVWTEERLKAMDIEDLESTYKSVVNVNQADYSLGADGPKVNTTEGPAPLMRVIPKSKKA